jgi:peroxiredoxin
VFGLLAAAVSVGFVVLGGRSPDGGATRGAATDFTLASTAGGSVSLADYRGSAVLLYFNEGVGCDACFYQTAELEKNAGELANAGLTVLPIVMNPVADTAAELQRFGLSTPYLVDADGSTTRAYGMLGKGMHANLPGHGFVLVDATGEVRWKMEYPSMFVPAGDLLDAVEPYLS